jgi:putative hydrolase of the HAD superfamily
MVEAVGADPKAYVYLDDQKPAHETGITAVKVLNAAQVVGEIETAKGLALRALLAKNAVSERKLPTRRP